MPKLTLKSLLVYSGDTDKGFFTEFSKSTNIVHGRNTSGKSTLIQSIIYSMGINDSKDNLNDIFESNVVFRLDCELDNGNNVSELVFVRADDTLVLKQGNDQPIRFDGINSNNSYEYGRYKNLFSNLIKFDLVLQKQSELVSAPLEAALLPYYISQSVGWVYIRESIGDYRFYKDFKLDYLDYYCGIESGHDKLLKYTLEKEKKELLFDLRQLDSYEERNDDFRISKYLNDRIKGQAKDFLEQYQKLNSELTKKEAEHTRICNKLSMLKGRQKVLNQIISNIQNQRPRIDQCPTCEQSLPGDLRDFYVYSQNINDAIKERERVKDDIKSNTSKLNSAEKEISSLRITLEKEFSILQRLEIERVTFDSWINHNVNLKILENLSIKKQAFHKRLKELNDEIKDIRNEPDVELLRKNKEKEFLGRLKKKAALLGVDVPKEQKYQELYSINSFPYQGVELHKLLMAYNFSFYEMAMENSRTHSLPFLLDAVFKEDIDRESRRKIFEFLSSESKTGRQIIFTVAEYKERTSLHTQLFDIEQVKLTYFNGNTKLICIGDGKTKRAFLYDASNIDRTLIDTTIKLLETV